MGLIAGYLVTTCGATNMAPYFPVSWLPISNTSFSHRSVLKSSLIFVKDLNEELTEVEIIQGLALGCTVLFPEKKNPNQTKSLIDSEC